MSGYLQLLPGVLLGVSVFLTALLHIATAPAYRKPQGASGIQLDLAIQKWPLFAYVHPFVQSLAYRLHPFVPGSIIERYTQRLSTAGTPLGLGATEFFALALMCTLAGAITGAALTFWIARQVWMGAALGALAGGAVPFAKLDGTIVARKAAIAHELPCAIDLIALCMRAGQHFGGALETVTREMASFHPLKFEFEYMVARMTLGASRQAALETLANRIDSVEIRQFVQNVIRGEQKGSSLSSIFSIQAEVMRTKRTQLAEQAASRAAVLLIGPLMLIFLAVLLLVLGPFAVKAFYGNLF